MISKKLYTTLFFFIIPMYLINPMEYGFIFGYCAIVFLLLIRPSINLINNTTTLLLCFSVCYALFYSFNLKLGTQYIFIYALLPLTFYAIGKLSVTYFDRKNLFPLIVLYSFLFALPSLFSVLLEIKEKGFATIKRDVPNLWSGEYENATLTAGFFALNMSIPAILIFTIRQNKRVFNILLISIFIITLLCVLRLGSRTHLAITLLTMVAGLIYLTSRQSPLKNFLLLFSLFIIVNIGFSYLSFDKDSDLISAYADRMDSKTNGAASAGGRSGRWMDSLEYLVKDPLGWELEEFGYSHNLWFDVGRVGGTISFILLVLFTFKCLSILYKFMKTNKKETITPVLFVFSTAFYLLFFVEPVFESFFQIFVFYCFICGLTEQLFMINFESTKAQEINNKQP
jgi:hypothetical protein